MLSHSPSQAGKRKAHVATAVLAEDTEVPAGAPELKRPKLHLHKYSASDKEALSGSHPTPFTPAFFYPASSSCPCLSPPLVSDQSAQISHTKIMIYNYLVAAKRRQELQL